jgi:hypothetical protein
MVGGPVLGVVGVVRFGFRCFRSGPAVWPVGMTRLREFVMSASLGPLFGRQPLQFQVWSQ